MENNPERRLMAYCVEKVGFSATVLGRWKIDLSDRLRIDDRKSWKGEAPLKFANILSGQLFQHNRPGALSDHGPVRSIQSTWLSKWVTPYLP